MTTLYLQRSQPHSKGPVMVSPHPNYPSSRPLFYHIASGLMTAVESHWDNVVEPIARVHGWQIVFPDASGGVLLPVAEPTESALVREVGQLRTQLQRMRDADLNISASYLRIREMLGAWDTKPGGEDRFEVTEQKLRDLLEERDMWKEEHDRAISRLNDLDIDF